MVVIKSITGIMKRGEIEHKAKSRELLQELIERCRRGDQKAQFQVYKLYHRIMFLLSYRIVNKASMVERIVHESFISAFDNMGSFSGETSFSGWLREIVVQRSLAALKDDLNITSDNSKELKNINLNRILTFRSRHHSDINNINVKEAV